MVPSTAKRSSLQVRPKHLLFAAAALVWPRTERAVDNGASTHSTYLSCTHLGFQIRYAQLGQTKFRKLCRQRGLKCEYTACFLRHILNGQFRRSCSCDMRHAKLVGNGLWPMACGLKTMAYVPQPMPHCPCPTAHAPLPMPCSVWPTAHDLQPMAYSP